MHTRLGEIAGNAVTSCSPRLDHSCRRSLVGRSVSHIARAKKDIHPKYFEESKVICNGEEVLTTSGTQETYNVDVWSGNHPFYTKSENQMLTDEGRVSRFNKRFDGLSIGQVGTSKPGDKKLEYKTDSKKKKMPQKGGKK